MCWLRNRVISISSSSNIRENDAIASQKKGIALVLGAGPNIGQALARTFTNAEYKVVLVSRSAPNEGIEQDGFLRIGADLTKPECVSTIFSTVRQKLGDPNIVVYNAGVLSRPLDISNLLTVDPADIESDMRLMNTTPYIAAREAVPIPVLTTLAMGKSAASAWIGMAAELSKTKGYRFYYADERTPQDLAMSRGVSASAHAETYLQLAEGTVEGPSNVTFVAGRGLVEFPETTRTHVIR
ncbi:hypothetical protein MANI_004268 [Metarhizium anisopliae]|nr:hypothetical protein MANI_004268 [Metarhizium anisopliae]